MQSTKQAVIPLLFQLRPSHEFERTMRGLTTLMGAVFCGCVLFGRVLLVRAEVKADGAGLAPCVCCLQLDCVSDVGADSLLQKWRVAAGESDPWLSPRRVRGQNAGAGGGCSFCMGLRWEGKRENSQLCA